MAIFSESPSLTTSRPPTDPPLKTMAGHSFRPNKHRYCKILLWAAGVVDDLPYPSEIIDVPVLAAIFWQHKGIGGLLSKGFSRSQSEILDAADITLRYDWACVEARVHGKEAPASLNGDVVMERHYAFNW